MQLTLGTQVGDLSPVDFRPFGSFEDFLFWGYSILEFLFKLFQIYEFLASLR